MTIVLTVGLMKKISLCKMSYFPEPYIRSKNKIKLELHLPNSAIKSDLKTQQVSMHQNLLKMRIYLA